MLVKLFVGNLPWGIGDVELETLFQKHGDVQSARVIMDRETGRSRGFGFVEIDVADPAAVISATNGMDFKGRPLRVNEAEEKGGPRRSGPPRDRGGDRGGDRGPRRF